MKHLDEITAVSSAAAEYISTMTDEPVEIIPNGIDLASYSHKSPIRAAKDRPMILYIGRLERRKGVKYLIKAFQQVQARHPDVELVIAGDGPDREKLEDMVGDLQLPNVRFLGYVSIEQKHELLSTASVFCSPAIFGESFGIVLLEAMAYELPVVAGNNAGYSSVMQGVGGISLVNPEDSIEFGRRLELMLYENDLRQLWLKWAKTYVKQFNYPSVIDQYEAAYKLAVKNHKAKALQAAE
jgi:phosphatidylinositol alpha-mannosyltransferase